MGVDNPFQCESIKKKCTQKHIKNYGVEHASQSSIVKSKIRATVDKNKAKSPYVRGNDVIIVCSDGLYEYINIQDVADKISNCAGNYKSVCEELTQEAIANGSKDNISIVTIPLIGQLRNVLPPGYNVSIDDSKEDSFDDDNYDSGIEEYQIDNNIYVLHLIILE